MNIYIFYRAGGFYPIELDDDVSAKANAERNPGTIKVENAATKEIVWVQPVCECQQWARRSVGSPYNIRTWKGVPVVTNHHEDCPRYNDSLMDVWKVTVGGISAYMDNEPDARETAGEDTEATVTKEKIHREIFENLPEFEGF